MNHIIVDFEMNPIAREYKAEKAICRSEIIEVGAIIMNDELTILGEYKTLVKPQYSTAISKKYESLTGISTHMVDGALCLRQLMNHSFVGANLMAMITRFTLGAME